MSAVPPGAGQRDPRLGPLGQPIRRINTFTTSLPSFEEEKPANLHMPSQHSSEGELLQVLLFYILCTVLHVAIVPVAMEG